MLWLFIDNRGLGLCYKNEHLSCVGFFLFLLFLHLSKKVSSLHVLNAFYFDNVIADITYGLQRGMTFLVYFDQKWMVYSKAVIDSFNHLKMTTKKCC